MKLLVPELLKQQALINGLWCEAQSNKQTEIYNPANGQPLGKVPLMGQADAKLAILSAEAALASWRSKTANERSQILRTWFSLILSHKTDLAAIITAEQGKPLAEAEGEVRYAASFIEWFAEEGRRIYGETIPAHQTDKRLLVIKQPIGVCAAITPWNFPAAMITRKVAPALAAGCCMIVKPAPQTPFTALALGQLALMAGIPAGVLNIITGDAQQIGDELCANAIVRKLSFTGSTAVGAKLMANCAQNIKKLSLELGGNAPFIVFDDADIDAAVTGAMAAKFRNNGQTCVCANRFYVHQHIYDEFASKLIAEVSKLKVGNGTEPGAQCGPLINDAAVAKVEQHINDALAKGADLGIGGKRDKLGGTFFEPTVLLRANKNMLIAREETFGPVAALIPFKDFDEVITAANDTEYGLAAYLYSNNLKQVWQTAESLEYGMIGVNTGLISTEVAPFGGIKASGLGREGGRQGIEEYLEQKYICLAI